MGKIPKNLSDKDMLKNYQEDSTIEETFQRAADTLAEKKQQPIPEDRGDMEALSLSAEIRTSLEQMLLELKVELYREGIVDYRLVVRRDGKNIILSPAAKKK